MNKISSLDTVRELLNQFEENFEIFTLDKYWGEDKLTIAFTMEKLKGDRKWRN